MSNNSSQEKENGQKQGKKPSVITWLVENLCREWRAAVTMILASTVMAFVVANFILPYHFPDMGLSGIGVMSKYIFGISPVWVTVIGNTLILIWGRKNLNTRFIFLTSLSILTFSIALPILEQISLPLPDDKFMGAVISGLLKGASVAIMFNVGGSSGGIDIVAAVIRRRYGIEVGSVTSIINFGILGLSTSIVGLESVVYGLIIAHVGGLATDSITRSFDRRKQAFVITNIPDEVSAFINKMGRGVTLLEGRGGYTHQPRPVLMALLEPRQVVQLKQFLRDEDPNAFVSICDATEVIGQGFKAWKSL